MCPNDLSNQKVSLQNCEPSAPPLYDDINSPTNSGESPPPSYSSCQFSNFSVTEDKRTFTLIDPMCTGVLVQPRIILTSIYCAEEAKTKAIGRITYYAQVKIRVASRDSRDREISRNWSFISRSRNKSNLENSREMKNDGISRD